MSALTLGELSAPLLVLRVLTTEFGHLPAPHIEVSTHFPDRLELSFHEDFAGFEAWREALAIDSEAVGHHVQGDGRTGVLTARTDFAGASLRLIGYATAPDAAAGGAG
ncbi:hypothetical protein ACWEFL_04070 [Streptomyces sp. NPDC004838]